MSELTLEERLLRNRREITLNYYREEFAKAMRNVGLILKRLRDDREQPWKLVAPTFEEFVMKEWGIGERRVQQLIAGEVAREETLALDPPKPVVALVEKMNTRQLTEVAKVPVPQRVEVIEKAAVTGKLTASVIKTTAVQSGVQLRKHKSKPVVLDGDTGQPVDKPQRCPHCGQRMP